MGECTAPPRSVQPSVPRWRPHSPRCSAQAASWPKQSSKQQEARSKKREARSKKRAASSEQRTDRSCRLPVPAHNSNYLENGRYYHGYRRGIYQYPCDEVSSFSLPCRNKTKQPKTKQPVLTRSAAREGPHGHLPQAVLRGAERLAAPGPRATTRRNSHSRSGHRHRHLGDRHGRVSWALHSASRNLQREVCEANRVCSKFLNAEVR